MNFERDSSMNVMETKEKDISSKLQSMLKDNPSCQGARACLFNLIVYTHEPRRTNYFNEMIKLIRTQFPCRIIFITAQAAENGNGFSIKTSTEKNDDGTGFICDQIWINAEGESIQQVYFLLLPLFVPDLPIYLLWGQDPTTEYSILPHLEHFATRLIFDGESTEDLQLFSRNLLERMKTSSIQVIDMNWARINGWREILAQIFDSIERLKQLSTANSVTVVYNSHPSEFFIHYNTQAIYLQAWLSNCLKWEFLKAEKENHSQLLFYQNGTNHCTIRLIPEINERFDPAEILKIEIMGEGGYECHIKRIKQEQAQVQASNQFQCELPFYLNMPNFRSGRAFMQEVFYQKMSSHYASMLQQISITRWS